MVLKLLGKRFTLILLLNAIIATAMPFLLCSEAIDPDVERYFEGKYGYLNVNNGYRESPVSIVSSDEQYKPDRTNKAMEYSVLSQADFTDIPLHYKIKNIATSGAISYYISKSDKENINFKSYTLIDINISKKNYSKVMTMLSKDYGFIMAGEENYIDKKDSLLTIFGWIEEKYFNKLSYVKDIESYSLSKRDIKAPVMGISMTVKIPNDRKIDVFVLKFIEKLEEYGFQKNNIEMLSDGKKYRFAVIKINGLIPIDKTRELISNPFVIKINS
jgi:hypothetical protein